MTSKNLAGYLPIASVAGVAGCSSRLQEIDPSTAEGIGETSLARFTGVRNGPRGRGGCLELWPE